RRCRRRNPQVHRATLQRFYYAFNAHDLPSILAEMQPEIEFESRSERRTGLEPEPLVAERWSTVVEFTVREISVAPDVLSVTDEVPVTPPKGWVPARASQK